MTVYSEIHLLDGNYPEADTYGEIGESIQIPGGETGNSAIVLSNWGHRTKICGPFLGSKTRDGLLGFFNPRGIDCTGLHYDESYDGVRDIVLVDKHSRTVFGRFAHYFSDSVKRWSPPSLEDIRNAGIVSIDPFFGEDSETAARWCVEAGKKYVTIDCSPESFLHRNAASTVISGEFIRNSFPGEDRMELMARYDRNSKGLTVFTAGSSEMLYSREGRRGSVQPYHVEVKSTLGAGDTFRAGIVHAVLEGFDDELTVRFAAATSAKVCSRFPMAINPPTLNEVMELAEK